MASRDELIRKITAIPVIGPQIARPFADILTTFEADIREQAGVGAKGEVTPLIIGIAGLATMALVVAWASYRSHPRRVSVAGLLPAAPGRSRSRRRRLPIIDIED